MNISGIRVARGEEYHYTKGDLRIYRPFSRLQYQTEDGEWHDVEEEWLGMFEQKYDPAKPMDEQREIKHTRF